MVSDIVKGIQAQLGSEEDPWYLQFLAWFHAQCPGIQYSALEQIFYQYNPDVGYYEPMTSEDIKKYLVDWADVYWKDHDTTESVLAHGLTRLRIELQQKEAFDSDPSIENCKNGILHLDTLELEPHGPQFWTKKQLPRQYRAPHPWALLFIEGVFRKLEAAATNGKRIRQFLGKMVRKDHSEELFFMAYGVRGGGKSTVLGIAREMFGRALTCATPLQKLGKRFGLSEIWDKRVCVNPDLAVKRLSADTVASLKLLTGGVDGSDGCIEVECKGKDSFTVAIACFLLYATNQMPDFTEDVVGEIESVMRRAVLVHYPTAQVPDPEFKRLLVDPEFLDDLYWVLLHDPPVQIKGDLDTYVEENTKEWLRDANPLLRILDSLVVRYEDPELGIPCKEVLDKVLEAYTEESIKHPSQIQQEITFALRSMRIYRNGVERATKSDVPKYMCCWWRDEPLPPAAQEKKDRASLEVFVGGK